MEEKKKAIENMYEGLTSLMILIIGRSGRGKSHSFRNLDPKTTKIINVLGKRLPFSSGVKYKEGENIINQMKSASRIIREMRDVSRKEPHVKNLIIDDGHYVMMQEFMEKAHIKEWEKWNILAKNIMDILMTGNSLRGDLKVYFVAFAEGGKMKTLGKLLEDKITPEGICPIVLLADVETGGDTGRKHFFITNCDGESDVKSPEGMFCERIPNDLDLVSKRIDEFYSGVEELEDSKLDFDIKS